MDVSIDIDWRWAIAFGLFVVALIQPKAALAVIVWAVQLIRGLVLLFVAAWPRR